MKILNFDKEDDSIEPEEENYGFETTQMFFHRERQKVRVLESPSSRECLLHSSASIPSSHSANCLGVIGMFTVKR